MEDAEHTGLITTRLTRLWGIDRPIIGAPMAGRSGGHLAGRDAVVVRGVRLHGCALRAGPNWPSHGKMAPTTPAQAHTPSTPR